jgi:hypothetical protein
MARAEGRLSDDELQAVEDQAILEALAKQRELGLDVCTDREMQRGPRKGPGGWLRSFNHLGVTSCASDLGGVTGEP